MISNNSNLGRNNETADITPAETPIDAPVTMRDGRTVPVGEARRVYGDNSVLHRFGNWIITTFGIECLNRPFGVPWRVVTDPHWVEHWVGKVGVVRRDVEAAFKLAATMPQAHGVGE